MNTLNDKEIWYEEEVKTIEDNYTEQLDACEKELDVGIEKTCDVEIQSRLLRQSREERRRTSKRIKRYNEYSNHMQMILLKEPIGFDHKY